MQGKSNENNEQERCDRGNLPWLAMTTRGCSPQGPVGLALERLSEGRAVSKSRRDVERLLLTERAGVESLAGRVAGSSGS